MATLDRRAQRHTRQVRARKKVEGLTDRPRLAIYRSNKHISAQIINDVSGVTLCGVSSYSKDFKDKINGSNIPGAEVIGKAIAEKALAEGVSQVVFDRGGNRYHGRVKALADAARKAGLSF